jgi:hypothetical protein
MKCSKRSFAVVSVLLAALLSLTTGTLNERDALTSYGRPAAPLDIKLWHAVGNGH